MVHNLKNVTATLQSFLSGDRPLPQAYFFMGTSGALDAAKSFATKILDQEFPNVDSIQFDAADDEASSVSAIREVIHMASLMPVQSRYKVVLMQHMDKASAQMMNALLKTLEEPPQHTIFLLVSHRPLLATIMSRCQVFNLAGTNDQSVELPEDVVEQLATLKKHVTAGTAERMALVSKLSELDDVLLKQVIEQWMHMQVDELRTTPQKFTATRNTMETLQSLNGNFNKKMVLQNFVLTGLA